jgi:hypothetical protein
MPSYLDIETPEEGGATRANAFKTRPQDRSFPVQFSDARGRLPAPFWDGDPRAGPALGAYWKVMELLFRNLVRATEASGFAGPFADAAFNGCLFMWDSVFMSVFWKYAVRGHDFQATLDTFYRKQLKDGFISREIREHDGTFQFHPTAPASTGPNVLAFSEWDYFLMCGDRARLAAVFPPLLAYHRWLARHRTWPDGSYWSCGLASGMDNQPRVLPGDCVWTSHSFTAWVDATAQALLSAKCLLRMAEALGCAAGEWACEVAALRAEAGRLEAYLCERMWCASQGTFCDRRLGVAEGVRGGAELSGTRTVGAYWALLAGVPLPPARRAVFLRALDDPALFNRPGRVPSLAANHEDYRDDGGYWCGAVWPPTCVRGRQWGLPRKVAHRFRVSLRPPPTPSFPPHPLLSQHHSAVGGAARAYRAPHAGRGRPRRGHSRQLP